MKEQVVEILGFGDYVVSTETPAIGCKQTNQQVSFQGNLYLQNVLAAHICAMVTFGQLLFIPSFQLFLLTFLSIKKLFEFFYLLMTIDL